MPYKIFVIPHVGCEAAEAEMNAFLRSHRVLHVESRWVELGPGSRWSFCVEYAEPGAGSTQEQRQRRERERVDYRAQLGPAEHAMFNRLRSLRTELSAQDRVPPYMVFNDKQLIHLVREKVLSVSDLSGLPGVGDARVQKYGQRFLDLLAEVRQEQPDASPPPSAAGEGQA